MAHRKVDTAASCAKTWAQCEPALDEVDAVVCGRRNAVAANNIKSKMKWYEVVYTACTGDPAVAERLYTQLEMWIEKQLKTHVTDVIVLMINQGKTDRLFHTVTKAFADFKVSMKFGKLVFHYISCCLLRRAGHLTIEAAYYKSFHRAVYEKVKVLLADAIVVQVNAHRDGNVVDMAALKATVGIFIDLGTSVTDNAEEKTKVYQRDYESHYIKALRTAYDSRSQAAMLDPHHYLLWCETKFDIEAALAVELLRADSHGKVRGVCEDTLIKPHMRAIIDHADCGCAGLLESGKVADVARMYRLMKNIPHNEAVTIMADAVGARVASEGEALIAGFSCVVSENTAAGDRVLVEGVLALCQKFVGMCRHNFENNDIFLKALKVSFERVLAVKISRREKKPGAKEEGDFVEKETNFSEVLSSYCDAVMKRDIKDITETDEPEHLDALIAVFAYITEKDVFQEFYQAKLARRLLTTTPYEDLEKAMLERLQRMMGKSFTNKMEGMMTDRESTGDYARKFTEDVSYPALPCEFSAAVLKAGHWPSYKADAVTLPLQLQSCIGAFERFYKSSNASRKLRWFFWFGQCETSVAFTKQTKMVKGTVHVTALLMTIDDSPNQSTKELAGQLGMDIKAVKPLIASIYLNKRFAMVNRVDAAGAPQATGKAIGDDDRFAMNKDFTGPMRKFTIPQSHSSTSQGMPTKKDDIEDRRKDSVDACIVRVMKSARTLSHNDLINGVVQQLSRVFTPQPRFIKKRVEDLILREYIKRQDDDATMFDYLA
jgi:hypothetical protein